jgi:Cytochrome c7 and related cytochrome c
MGSLGESCSSCHNTVAWAAATFDHSGATGFALNGAHADLECSSCHSAGTVAGSVASAAMVPLPVDCAGCHSDDDPHLGQLGSECATCHFESGWTGRVLFDHDLTLFPLVGVHAETGCAMCHSSTAFHDAGEQCVDCHASDDVHAGTFGIVCATCHNPTAWQAWMFDHDAATGFPLDGAHGSLSCATCHESTLQNLAGAATNCAQCHRNDDPHDGRFGGSCGDCHTTESF